MKYTLKWHSKNLPVQIKINSAKNHHTILFRFSNFYFTVAFCTFSNKTIIYNNVCAFLKVLSAVHCNNFEINIDTSSFLIESNELAFSKHSSSDCSLKYQVNHKTKDIYYSVQFQFIFIYLIAENRFSVAAHQSSSPIRLFHSTPSSINNRFSVARRKPSRFNQIHFNSLLHRILTAPVHHFLIRFDGLPVDCRVLLLAITQQTRLQGYVPGWGQIQAGAELNLGVGQQVASRGGDHRCRTLIQAASAER